MRSELYHILGCSVFGLQYKIDRYELYLLSAIGLTPGGSSTVHIYTQTVHGTTQNFGRVRAVPRLCELYPRICLTTEEKHRKTSVSVHEECHLAR